MPSGDTASITRDSRSAKVGEPSPARRGRRGGDLRRRCRGGCVWRPLCWGVASSVHSFVRTAGDDMASTTAAPAAVHLKSETATTTSAVAQPVNARRHFAWLVGGMAGSFLVPFVLADQLALQRDLYYAVYVAFVVGLFVLWARDTRQSLRETVAPRRRP